MGPVKNMSATTRNNDDSFHWQIYASQDLNELTTKWFDSQIQT